MDNILAVKIDGQFSSVAAELREAYASGPLGQKIFGRAVALVLDSKLEEIIRKQIQAMLAKSQDHRGGRVGLQEGHFFYGGGAARSGCGHLQ